MHTHRLAVSFSLLCSAALTAGTALALTDQPAGAASMRSFTVNSKVDAPNAQPHGRVCADSAGKCTLRGAIQAADVQAPGTVVTITVPSGTYALQLGALVITASTIKIQGAGVSATVIKNAAGAQGQLVSVAPRAMATLRSLELTGGTPSSQGGGALVNKGTTALNGVVVTGNSALSGGGLTNAKGATLSLVGTTVSNNQASAASSML